MFTAFVGVLIVFLGNSMTLLIITVLGHLELIEFYDDVIALNTGNLTLNG